jgi:hypothetical protein
MKLCGVEMIGVLCAIFTLAVHIDYQRLQLRCWTEMVFAH